MRYFYDTEFIDNGRIIDLISIGVAAEDGREFYAVSAERQIAYPAVELITRRARSLFGANPR